MKKAIFLLITYFLISCSNSKEPENQIQNFIDVDVSADYKYYFDNLSSEYKDILKLQYNTSNLKVVYDSIVKNRKDIHDSIVAKKFVVKNYLIDSFSTSNKDLRIIKYRNNIYDTKHKSELFKEKIILEINHKGETKFTPYNPKSIPKIDSILSSKYSLSILNEIHKSLSFKQYENRDINFQKTKKRFEDYIANFKSNDLTLLEFVYPPIFQSLLASNNQTEFTQEQKRQLVEYIKKGRDSQKLNFKRFLIDKFNKISCSSEKNAYILNYAIDVENNLYIPGKLIVIIENEKVYFVEADIEELRTNYSNVFSKEFINCVESSITD
jgi:hypothetical protein